jgi:hypothetical protein
MKEERSGRTGQFFLVENEWNGWMSRCADSWPFEQKKSHEPWLGLDGCQRKNVDSEVVKGAHESPLWWAIATD